MMVIAFEVGSDKPMKVSLRIDWNRIISEGIQSYVKFSHSFLSLDCVSKTSSTTDFTKAAVNSCGSDSRLENV